MKKKSFAASGVLLISILALSFFTSCDKNTYSDIEVTVTDSFGAPIYNAFVDIYADGGSIRRTGYTDKHGVFTTQFGAPAIFGVHAKYELFRDSLFRITINDTTLREEHIHNKYGEQSIRLKEGETVTVTVPLISNSIDTINYENR